MVSCPVFVFGELLRGPERRIGTDAASPSPDDVSRSIELPFVREVSRRQARHYARALFHVAEEKGAEESVRLRGELHDLVQHLEQNSELRSAVHHPAVTPEARGRALRSVVESAGGSELLGRVLTLLAGHGHLGLLPAVSSAFAAQVNAARGVVPARATGAVELSAEQEGALAEALRKSTGAKIELRSGVDPMVLGGLQVTVGGKTYDGTVRGRLASLRRRLASGN